MSSSRSFPTPTDLRTVARVLGPKGLRGGLRLELVTDWPDRLAVGAELLVEGEVEMRRIERVESGGRATVVYLAGIGTREAAETLSGRYLEMVALELPRDTFYWDELVGLEVVAPGGAPIGQLVEVFRAGGNEVYRVVGPRGERLVPALRSVVLAVDLEAGRMIVADDESEEVD